MPQNINKGVIIGLVVVLALTGFFMIKGRNINPVTSLDGVYSIKDIISMNKNLECKFDRADESTKVSGAIIVSEGRVKGEFDIKSAGQNFKSYFLMKDGVSYTWTSLAKAGFKAPVVDGTAPTNKSEINTEEKGEYRCNNWTEVRGTFDVPQDILFSPI